ncbi:BON domain-containing protein [Legionella nagasakiensis]|uniref:BON domain-containing protein n=1 Tax=Legionella nagasakiensis TaxID=535290 RepID=UPI0010555A3D|nr:BON domain-containing protein [Legionella nagasakiensis]
MLQRKNSPKRWYGYLPHVFMLIYFVGFYLFAWAEKPPNSNAEEIQSSTSTMPEVSHHVEIKPSARDEEIRQRIESILIATTWYEETQVKVNDGVVFLQGKAKTEAHKKWAENLARNTQGVVAVVNEIKIVGHTSWYFQQIM